MKNVALIYFHICCVLYSIQYVLFKFFVTDLRVTTDTSSQINNTRSLVSSDTKSHIVDSSSASTAAVNNNSSVSKKSHLLTTDIKDDKQQHIVTIGGGSGSGNNSGIGGGSISGSLSCDLVETSSFKEHHSKYLDKNHTINVESRHGIIGEF